MTGSSLHEQKNHIFRFRREVRLPWASADSPPATRTGTPLQLQQIVERNRPNPARAPFEKIATGLNLLKLK
jgi:hypothetical protein